MGCVGVHVGACMNTASDGGGVHQLKCMYTYACTVCTYICMLFRAVCVMSVHVCVCVQYMRFSAVFHASLPTQWALCVQCT